MPDESPQLAQLHQSVSDTRQTTEDARPLLLISLCLLALVVGIVTGLGAVAFRALIACVHNLLFLGHWSFYYDSSVFTPPSPWGPWVILVPVIGAIGVTFIVNNFAPEAKGHGVPEVMDAIYYNRGVIRPVVAVAKSLASALAIGSGAAVGREGPIIQIGSALGSTFGQVIRMSMGQRIILVAAGAGAGIAATFNTPIGGVLFATELMLPEISVNTFLPVAIATGTATFIGRLFFGAQPAFSVPSDLAPLPAEPSSALILLLYVGLGAVVGVAAAVFVRSLHWAEDGFDKIPGRYLRHMLGMLLVGALIYALMRWGGHYYVEGVGYATIQATLTGQLAAAGFLLLLYACKLVATSVSLGSGSSGGIFSPSLFMGATLGGAFAGAGVDNLARSADQYPGLRDGGHGHDGGKRHRRGDDRGGHDLRDDPRLRHRAADDPGGSGGPGRPPHAVAREHLHHEAGAARPSDSEGAARQYVPGAQRQGCDGARLPADRRGNQLRRIHAHGTGIERHAPRGGDPRQPDRRRVAGEHRAAADGQRRVARRYARRPGAAELHDRAGGDPRCST